MVLKRRRENPDLAENEALPEMGQIQTSGMGSLEFETF